MERFRRLESSFRTQAAAVIGKYRAGCATAGGNRDFERISFFLIGYRANSASPDFAVIDSRTIRETSSDRSYRRRVERRMLPSRSRDSASLSPSLILACLAIFSGIRTARLAPDLEIVVSFRIYRFSLWGRRAGP